MSAGTLSAANYSFAFASGALTVTKVSLTITAPSPSRTYGAANPTFTPTYAGFVAGDSAASLTTAPTCTTTATVSSPVGTYPVTCSGAVDPNYTFAFVSGILTITKAPLTITASSATIAYGTTVPAITPTYTGFVAGDTAASLSTAPTCTTTATSHSPVGSYPSSCSGAADPNYTISYVPGTLTVTPATLTVTADSKSKTYGSANPGLTYSIAGFVNGDTSSVVSGAPILSTSATSSSPVGVYPITVSAGTLSAANYSFAFASGALTVTKVSLTITAPSPSRTYGAANPTFTPTYAGFVAGDSAASLTTAPTCTTTATVSSPVGTYPVTCSGAVDPNYTFAFVSGILTITKAPLTITASSATIAYGTTVPAITPTYTGFVAGDTAASLSTAPTCTTTATSHSPVGSYPSSCSGAADPNYTISYVAGSVSVVVVDRFTTTAGTTLNVTAPGIFALTSGTVTAVSVTTAPQGKLTLQSSGAFTYVPKAGFTGTDTFTYKATINGKVGPATTVTIFVISAGASCTSCNLSGLTLGAISLAGVNYTSANMASVVAPGANFSGSNLTSATLTYASLSGTNLTGTNLTGANLSNADLSKVNASGANLSNANLTGTVLTGANLTGANLTGATTTGATFTGVTWSNTTCPDGTNSNSHGNTCVGHLTPLAMIGSSSLAMTGRAALVDLSADLDRRVQGGVLA